MKTMRPRRASEAAKALDGCPSSWGVGLTATDDGFVSVFLHQLLLLAELLGTTSGASYSTAPGVTAARISSVMIPSSG